MHVSLTRRASMLAMAGAGVVAAAPALAQTTRRLPAAVERDRQSILAMAGDYHVRFNFNETVPFVSDYTPLEPKTSGGYESVRVIEDTGTFIQLQHMLVAEHEGQTFVIKHWRQDWTYQPRNVLVYERRNYWTLANVSSADRRGAWSQTVWQTDDSPRYGGVGRWNYDNGRTIWTSGPTLRPLARRDAIRNPVYNRYNSINRHALTPNGWVHEQDNEKIGDRNGQLVAIVHEDGVNTYERFTEYPVAAADSYWTDTREYWAGVRGMWDAAIARRRGVWVEEEAQNGAITGPALMGLADRIHSDEIETTPALAEAQTAIATATSAA
ncbi:DUF6607 family protein [Terricaulis silvestris]|uniref:Secreted protein n=1 Tax=Terricaulis silvestris TaxID=2686094 RepID=A0A6I6MUQ4_9CAUL|nr:DUF6607 family protein [Terricaulis silvestris]QGZ95392.1 hypothetical protein DSM104635_02241 [Terricaulis silvestris]